MHGYRVHQELVPNASWMQTLVLAITGRMYSAVQIRLIEAMFVVTSYADPRLWCNRVSALAGTARCPANSSISAGIASSEARIYGGQAIYLAARNIHAARRVMEDEGEEGIRAYLDTARRKYGAVYGYGRPLVSVEERIPPIEAMAERLGIENGPHLVTAKHIESCLGAKHLILNYGGYMAARLLDMDFTPREAFLQVTTLFHAGLLPCYMEAFENEPGTFLPIACEDISYEGLSEREVP